MTTVEIKAGVNWRQLVLKVTLKKSKPHPSVLLAPCLLAPLHPALPKLQAALWQVPTHSHKTLSYFHSYLGPPPPLMGPDTSWKYRGVWGDEKARGQTQTSWVDLSLLEQRHLIHFQFLMSLIWDVQHPLCITPPSPPNTYPLQSVLPAHTPPDPEPVPNKLRSRPRSGQRKGGGKGRFRRRGGGVQRAGAAFELNLYVP